MRFLITGGAGFIGSHLAEHLLAFGHTVTVVDNLSTGKLDNLAAVLDRVTFHLGDIADESLVAELVGQSDVVMHLAASLGVSFVTENPIETIENNITATMNVLRHSAEARCRFVLASTSEVYGKASGAGRALSEAGDIVYGGPQKSRWSYAASKLVDEFLTLAYSQRYGLFATAVRLFNVIGPRQSNHYGMVVPSFVQQAVRGPAITVYGSGQQSRCFCDVRDVVRAIAQLALTDSASGRVFNIGSERPLAIAELARIVSRMAGERHPVEFLPYEDVYPAGYEDVDYRMPDLSALREAIQWQPEFSLESTLGELLKECAQPCVEG